MSPRVLSIFSLLVALAAAAPPPRVWPAEQEQAASAGGVLRFRRVHVPADQPEQWPRGDVPYMPIDPAEFDRLLRLTRIPRPGVGPSIAARVIAARYQARLSGGRLVSGQGSLQVVHAARTPTLLRLDPCGVAVAKARWAPGGPTVGGPTVDGPSSDGPPADEPGEATLGLGADGTLAVLVERSGRLEFEWSLAGSGDVADALEFQCELPRCPSNLFLLDLPENLAPLTDCGVVLPAVSADGGEGDLRRWRIALGGHHRFRLRVVPAAAAGQDSQLAFVRQSTVYSLSLAGLEVSAQLHFQVHHEPLREIHLALDPELQLVTAQYGDQGLPWFVTSADGGPVTRVVLRLPEPVRGTGRGLELRALAPLKTAGRWRLPRIRPEGMFWQEGDVTLLVPPPLSVEGLVPHGCRQSGTASAPKVGQSGEFQCFAPNATVEIVLSRRRVPVQVASGTAVALTDREMTALVRAHFRIADGLRFLLEADVSPRWLIDSVESVPAEAIDDWTLSRQKSGGRKLTVRLAHAISPARPLQLAIAARRLQSPLGRELGIDDLVPVRFDATADGVPLVAVDAVGPYRLQLAAAPQLPRVDPRSLDAAERQLFAELPRNLLFRHDRDAAELRISLQRQEPAYTGTLRVEALVGDGALRENYTIRCVPESARVDRVLVRFSPPRAVPVQWSLAGEDNQQLFARRLPTDEQTTNQAAPETETWELRLRRPRSAAFEVRGSREVKLVGQRPVSLASLPDATGQWATLVIRSPDPKHVRIQNHRLRSFAAETVPRGRCQTALGTYRYDPPGEAAIPDPAVTVSVSGRPVTAPACVWNYDLESRYEPDGTGRHLARYWVQRFGAGRMDLILRPAAALEKIEGVWLDEKPVGRYRERGQPINRVSIDLPADEKFPTVAIHFTTNGPRLGAIGSLDAPLLQTDLPVLSQSWTAWLPPGYAAYGSIPRWQPSPAPEVSRSQRLLGPLGRTAGEPIFDPLAPKTWSGTPADRAARRSADRQAEQVLQLVGALATTSAADPEMGGVDWAGLLEDESIDALPRPLLLDRHALARLGLAPRTPVRLGFGDSSAMRGLDVLRKANLALLVHPDATVLTGGSDAALSHGWLAPLGRPCVWQVLPGPLADRVRQAGERVSGSCLVTVETWAREAAEPTVLWAQAGLAGRESFDTHGWTAYRMSTSGLRQAADVPPTRLKFIHRTTFRLLGPVTFLLVGALLWWKAGDRPVWLTSAVGVFGTAALLVHDPYVPMASGAVLAGLFCLVLRLVCRRNVAKGSPPDTTRNPPTGSTVSKATQLGIAVLLAAATSSLRGAARGEAAEGSPLRASPPVHQVFIPVDADRQPTGGKYYVPVELYNRLYRRAAEATEKPQAWLIAAATYRGVLSKAAASEGFVVDELKANFDLRVFDHTAPVRIPEGLNFSPDGALLDGRLIHPEKEPGGALLFKVPQPGRYRLGLSVRPTVHDGDAPSGFDVRIPRLASSRLELTMPPGAPAVEVPSALGSTRFQDEAPQVIAQLGPSDRLEVCWPGSGRARGSGATVDVEELLWLKVQPGSVVVDAKFKFKIIEGQIRQIQLATDPRLRLLPLQGDSPLVAQVRTAPGQPQIITLEFPQPVSDAVVVEATFLLTETSGVGNVRLPQLEVLEARSTRRWMAVSVADVLQYEVPASVRLQTVALPEFVSAWGKTGTQPQFAYRLGTDETDWSMSTRPQEPRTTVDQTLSLSFDRSEAEVSFDALLMTTAGYSFQYRVSAPSTLEVEHVSVTEEGVQRAARWSSGDNGVITVFLNGPVDGQHELSLHGRLPTPGKQMPLPMLQIEGAESQSSEVQLFRRPAVRLQVGRTSGLAEVSDPAVAADRAEMGRLVRRFRAEREKRPQAVLTIQPNRPKVVAEQVTWLYHAGDSWATLLDCRIRVDGGVVDEIRIDAPRPFDGPYGLQADLPATLKDFQAPGERRRLIVRPQAAIAGEYRFSVSSPLQVAPGERPAVPRVALLQVDDLRRSLALPRQMQGQPIGWETRGLKEAELPDGLVAPTDSVTFTGYEVTDDPYQAILRPLGRAHAAASVRLADVCIAWQPDGSCRGVATFDLEPGKSRRYPLQLPAGYRLVHVSVAGVPAEPVPAGPGKWTLPLGSDRLPQRIEVLFDGSLPRPGRTACRLEAPALSSLPVAKTLWTVAGPSVFEPGRPEQGRSTTAWHHELARLNSTAMLIESASMVSAEDPEETPRWYRRWARRLMAARAGLKRQSTATGPSREARLEIREIDRQQRRIAEQLGMMNILAQLAAEAPVADQPDRLWHWWLARRGPVTRCAFPEWAGSLRLTYRRMESGRLRRVATAVALALGLGLGVFGLRRGTWTEWFRQWPQATGVAVGLAWWLWLSPSVLGWGIVLVSLATWLRSGWKSSAPRPGSSVISLRSLQR